MIKNIRTEKEWLTQTISQPIKYVEDKDITKVIKDLKDTLIAKNLTCLTAKEIASSGKFNLRILAILDENKSPMIMIEPKINIETKIEGSKPMLFKIYDNTKESNFGHIFTNKVEVSYMNEKLERCLCVVEDIISAEIQYACYKMDGIFFGYEYEDTIMGFPFDETPENLEEVLKIYASQFDVDAKEKLKEKYPEYKRYLKEKSS